jgi:hypothetical protein
MWTAASALYLMGESARTHEQTLPVLLQLTASSDGPRRAAAAYALGGIARNIDDAVGQLLELTHDPYVDEHGYGGHLVAGYAMTALGNIGRQSDRVVPRLVEMLGTFEEFDSDMSYGGNHARLVAALQQFGRPPATVIPAVIACLERSLSEGIDDWNDKDLLELLTSIGPDASSALPVLEKLAIADEQQRREAEEREREDYDEDEADDATNTATDDDESSIRKTIRAIGGTRN